MRLNTEKLKKLSPYINSVSAITVLLLVIKVLGFVKVRIIAELFGTSRELDIFWAAFTIPDTVFNVLVAGAVNAAIIPVFTNVLHLQGEKGLKDIFKKLSFVYSLFFVVFSVVLFIFSKNIGEALISSNQIHNLVGSKVVISMQDVDLFSKLMRIMLLSPILLGISSLISAFLQANKKFFFSTLAPLLYNIGMIVGSILLVKNMHLGVAGMAWSVVVGSLLHLVIQIPEFLVLYKSSTNGIYKRIKDFFADLWSSEIIKVVKLAVPRIIGLMGEQINAIINTVISFTLPAGALSAYKFAFGLHLFPIQIFSAAIGQVVLPHLSEQFAKNDKEAFMQTFNKALRQLLFIMLPISAIILVLRLPLVRLAYGVGAFDWWATVITSWCLALLALSIVAQSVVLIIWRAFYAIHETKLPLIATAATIVVNLLATYYLTNFFSHYWDWRPILSQITSQLRYMDSRTLFDIIGSFFSDTARWMQTRNSSDAAVGGIALAMSLAFFVEMLVAGWLLNKKIRVFSWKYTFKPIFKMVLNTLLTLISMYFVFRLTDFSLDTTRTISIIMVTGITSGYGMLAYIIGAKVMNISELGEFTEKVVQYTAPLRNIWNSIKPKGRHAKTQEK